MKTWAEEAGVVPPGKTIDRDAGEGPPRCCARRFVAADSLVQYGELTAALLAKVRDRFPHLTKVAADQLYLCDGCRETLRREHIIARTEMPTSRPLSRPEAL